MRRFQDDNFIPGADDVDGDDPFAQVDGDASPQFVDYKPSTTLGLRSPLPPWHLWGGTQQVQITLGSFGAAGVRSVSQQLVKISYRRPESWHWLFAAKLVSGPASGGFLNTIAIGFDLTVGIGRSPLIIQPSSFSGSTFENYKFQWGPSVVNFPVGALIYTGKVLAPNRAFATDAPFPDQDGNAVPPAQSASEIDSIVAQDLQCNCNLLAFTNVANVNVGAPIVVEVSAFFSPKTHVRPDWYQSAPDELVFPGAETGGT